MPMSYGSSSGNFMIGTFDGQFLDGEAADVQVYSTTFSQQQVVTLYQQGISSLPLSGTTPIALFPLDGDTSDYLQMLDTGLPTSISYYSQPGTPYQTPSISGSGLYFNGASSNVLVNGQPHYNNANTMSVSAWVDQVSPAPSPTLPQTIVAQPSKYILELNQFSNSRSEALFSPCVGGSFRPVQAKKSDINTNSWYMVTGVYNGTAINVYVNGVLEASQPQTGNLCAGGSPTMIGAVPSTLPGPGYFNGTISDVQVYDVALSAQQVGQLYEAGIPISRSISVPLGGVS